MKNTKRVMMRKLSDDSLKNVSGGMIGVGGFVGEIIVHFLVCSGLVVGGAIGTIGCAVASGKQFSKGNIAAGSGLAAGAVGSAGALAAGVALLKKYEND